MGKTIIKLVFLVVVVYLLWNFALPFVTKKGNFQKFLLDLKTFVKEIKKPVALEKVKTEIKERRPLSEEEKEIIGKLSQGKYNFPVLEKLEKFLKGANLKNLIQKFRLEQRKKEEQEQPLSEEEKEIIKSIRKAERESSGLKRK